MLRLALRNLFQSKARLVMSVGGAALALLLILALDAIFAGVEEQITAYLDHSGADVWVAQAGVRNLHMASSSLPASAAEQVMKVPGVASATPILYVSNMVVMGEQRYLAYVIGLPADAAMGGPWRVSQGVSIPQAGQVVLDRGVAGKAGVGLGSKVKILGQEFTIAGLSEGTASLINSIAFISLEDFARIRGPSPTLSFLLIKVEPGQSPAAVAGRIEADVAGVTAQTRPAFSQQELKVVQDMSTDLVAIMNLVGFLVGLAVMALTVYTATFARRAEYGVLKALGARNGQLYRVVLAQALGSVALGFALGLALTLLLSAIVPWLGLNLMLQVSALSLLKVGGMALVIAGLAAALPIKQIAALDPASVFRGGVK